MSAPHLSTAEEALIEVSAALAARDEELLEAVMCRAASAAPAGDVEEVVLQSYLFLGYPVALNALGLWRRVSGEEPGAPAADDDEWPSRGERVCQAVYGGQYERLRANVERLHPDLERWMVAEGYGKVLGRPGPELRVRELCVVACLTVLDVPRQLYSHMRGALNVGAAPGEVERALEIALPMTGEAAARTAHRTWSAVRGRPAEAT